MISGVGAFYLCPAHRALASAITFFLVRWQLAMSGLGPSIFLYLSIGALSAAYHDQIDDHGTLNFR